MSTPTDDQEWAWRARAACGGVNAELFFHPDGERGAERRWRDHAAKQVCERCPVRDPCLGRALNSHEHYGVWGGLSAEEREVLLESESA
jgi:WhiB family transcriptional regulator, redox-sensing transcriptional regulator